MLHFKDHALARREPLKRGGDVPADFLTHQVALRVGSDPAFPLPVKEVGRPRLTAGDNLRRLVFRAAVAPAHVVEAHIRDDAIDPGIKAALEAEAVHVLINFKESFLVDATSVCWES